MKNVIPIQIKSGILCFELQIFFLTTKIIGYILHIVSGGDNSLQLQFLEKITFSACIARKLDFVLSKIVDFNLKR